MWVDISFDVRSFSPDSFGPSWGLTWEAAQDDLDYGRATNPNIKLRRIVDVHVAGAGAQLELRTGIGDTKVGQERTHSVRVFGTGAVLRISSGEGAACAATHLTVCESGTGASLSLVQGTGGASAGFGCAGGGALLRLVGGNGVSSSGNLVSGKGTALEIAAGTLDDATAIRNPTDEELAVLAYQLYKLVA